MLEIITYTIWIRIKKAIATIIINCKVVLSIIGISNLLS